MAFLRGNTDQRRDHIKMNFDYFQIQKWKLQTVRLEKVDEKHRVICLVLMCPSWVMGLKLLNKVYILQFWADLNKKPNSVKLYIHLKVLITLFQKKVWFIGVWATVHEILAIKISKKMLTQQKYLLKVPFSESV